MREKSGKPAIGATEEAEALNHGRAWGAKNHNMSALERQESMKHKSAK